MTCTNYQQASDLLTGHCKNSRKLANNTYLERRGDSIAVRLHNTDVVTYRPQEFELNSGGWRTVTTKTWMNEFSPASLYQRKSIWYIGRGDSGRETLPYFEGMRFDYGGKLLCPPKSKGKQLGEAILQKEIADYANLCAEALPLDPPGAGDCFDCQMREVKTGKPISEISDNKGHLTLHFVEKYVVPSLVYRALELYGSRASFLGAFKSPQVDNAKDNHFLEHAQRIVKSSVKKYLRRRFGLAG